MAWCLDSDSQENDLFLLINGNRAINKRGEEFQGIESIRPGRNADELWIKYLGSPQNPITTLQVGAFDVVLNNLGSPQNPITTLQISFVGEGEGRRLRRSLFNPCNWFSRNISLENNTTFISSCYENSNLTRQGTVSVRKTKRPAAKQMPSMTDVTDPSPTEPLITNAIKNKLLGQYELDINCIRQPEESMLCRNVKTAWVQMLKIKLKKSKSHNTIIPVMVDSAQVAKIEEFKEDKLMSYKYFSLGGNHLTRAVRELVEESDLEELSELRKFQTNIYVNLTTKEARFIGNRHNVMSKTLQLTFQDKVFQANQLRKESEDNLRSRLVEALCFLAHEELTSDSLSTIISVAKYNRENFKMFQDLVQNYELANGVEKSLPQNLFRCLQGMSQETVNQSLQKALLHGITNATASLKREKNILLLQKVFTDETDSANWDMAAAVYPEEADKIQEFADIPMKKKYVPQTFLTFCYNARDRVMHPNPQFSVNVDIQLDGNQCVGKTAQKIIKKYTQKIMNDLSKSSHSVSAEESENEIERNMTQNTCSTQVTRVTESQMSTQIPLPASEVMLAKSSDIVSSEESENAIDRNMTQNTCSTQVTHVTESQMSTQISLSASEVMLAES